MYIEILGTLYECQRVEYSTDDNNSPIDITIYGYKSDMDNIASNFKGDIVQCEWAEILHKDLKVEFNLGTYKCTFKTLPCFIVRTFNSAVFS